MKYAIFFLVCICSLNSFARSIYSLQDSRPIMEIVMFMQDNHEDFVSYYKYSDQKIALPKSVSCSKVSANDVLKEFKKSFNVIIRKFPDEDLPYSEALVDMEDYLDHQAYQRCVIDSNLLRRSDANSVYFKSMNDEIHLRMDNIAPIEK